MINNFSTFRPFNNLIFLFKDASLSFRAVLGDAVMEKKFRLQKRQTQTPFTVYYVKTRIMLQSNQKSEQMKRRFLQYTATQNISKFWYNYRSPFLSLERKPFWKMIPQNGFKKISFWPIVTRGYRRLLTSGLNDNNRSTKNNIGNNR